MCVIYEWEYDSFKSFKNKDNESLLWWSVIRNKDRLKKGAERQEYLWENKKMSYDPP